MRISGWSSDVCSSDLLLFSEAACAPVDANSLVQVAADGGLARVRAGGEGSRTEIYCGFLGSASPDNSLIQSLPSRQRWRPRGKTAGSLSLCICGTGIARAFGGKWWAR